jgi:ParB-like chromosome segregation protein Spo0J
METNADTQKRDAAAPEPSAESAAEGVPALPWVPDRIEIWEIDRLRPDPHNARVDHDVPGIRASMRKHGFPRPILTRADGRMIAGEGRWTAAKLEGYPLVPVIVAPPEWSEEQCREYALADNALGLASAWDDNKLREEGALLMARGVRLEELGFPRPQLEDLGLMPKAENDGPQVRKAKKAGAQLGGLTYQVLVACKDETDQRDTLARLTAEGFKCRALIS